MEAVMTQHIVMTPGTCGGRARIDGTRIRVMDVVCWYHHQHMSVPEIADEYLLTEGQVFLRPGLLRR